MSQIQYTYIAFISYKREDEEWAKWLQKRLEHYKLPTEVRKLNPYMEFAQKPRHVFKDTTDLSGGVLSKVIKEGLNSSKYLIVICSTRSAKSEWVCKEVQYFIDSGREEYIIPFIVDGEPNAKNSDDECFPIALKKLVGNRELLGINVNENGRDSAAVKVVSRLFDLKFDTLWDRFQRMERRNRLGKFSLVLFILILIGSIFSLKYIQSIKQKQWNKETALWNKTRKINLVNELNSIGLPLHAVKNIIHIYEDSTYTNDIFRQSIDYSIRNSLEQLLNPKCELLSVRKDTIPAFNVPKQRYYLDSTSEKSEYLYVMDSYTGKKTILLDRNIPTISYHNYSHDGKLLFVPPVMDDIKLQLVDLTLGKHIATFIPFPSNFYTISQVTSVKNDKRNILYRFGHRMQIGIMEYDILSGSSRNIISYPYCDANVWAEYSPSGQFILLVHNDGFSDRTKIAVLNATSLKTIYNFKDFEECSVFEDFRELPKVTWDRTSTDDVVLIEDRSEINTPITYSWKFYNYEKQVLFLSSIWSMAVSNSGRYISYTTDNDSLYIYDSKYNKYIHKELYERCDISFSNNETLLCATPSTGGRIRLINIQDPIESLDFDVETQTNYNCDFHPIFSMDDKIILLHDMMFGALYICDISKKEIVKKMKADSIYTNIDRTELYIWGNKEIISNKQIIYRYNLCKNEYEKDYKLPSNFTLERVTYFNKTNSIYSNNKEFMAKISEEKEIVWFRSSSRKSFLRIFSSLLH